MQPQFEYAVKNESLPGLKQTEASLKKWVKNIIFIYFPIFNHNACNNYYILML
jgi:hypothetical protein